MKLEALFFLLVFPGLLFSGVLGMVVGWVDRKVSARFQFRVGPPLLQNFNDFFKLMGKETMVPREAAKGLFLAAPFVAAAATATAAALIGTPLFFERSLYGDVIVVLYLLMVYSVMVFLGGGASGNVYSGVGAAREIKLLLADELVFILVLLVPIIKSGYQLRLQALIEAQQQGAFISSISGVIAFILALLCVQAKMTLPPFSIPEAETEIVEGPLMEYSGPPLAFWKLGQALMWVVFPFLLILLFWGGFDREGPGPLWFVLKYLLIVVIMIIFKNTNPRIRIDTAIRFFWNWAAPAALLAVLLAVLGV